MAYKGVDFYNCDELFSEEEILIRDSVRQFVTDQLMPVINEHNREGTFPAQLVPVWASWVCWAPA
jgi:glutaryl-CoA dehydrogenase